jgi:hypothetical protein
MDRDAVLLAKDVEELFQFADEGGQERIRERALSQH